MKKLQPDGSTIHGTLRTDCVAQRVRDMENKHLRHLGEHTLGSTHTHTHTCYRIYDTGESDHQSRAGCLRPASWPAVGARHPADSGGPASSTNPSQLGPLGAQGPVCVCVFGSCGVRASGARRRRPTPYPLGHRAAYTHTHRHTHTHTHTHFFAYP